MYLDSSRLSVNGSFWAPYFKSFVENSSAGDTGVNFNPSHLFPLSRLSPCTVGVSIHSLSSFLPPPNIPPFLSAFPSSCPLLSPAVIARGQSGGREEGRGCLCQESLLPLHPSVTPTNLSLWLAPLLSFPQAPETPSAPPCPSSEGCL